MNVYQRLSKTEVIIRPRRYYGKKVGRQKLNNRKKVSRAAVNQVANQWVDKVF